MSVEGECIMENSRIREMASVAEKASIMLAAINTGLKTTL